MSNDKNSDDEGGSSPVASRKRAHSPSEAKSEVRGRKSKVAETENKEKKDENVSEKKTTAAEKPKRGPGRPPKRRKKKNALTFVATGKGRGRPKKVQEV